MEYSEHYPKTAACENYLQLRQNHEETESKRQGMQIFSAIAGTSGFINAQDSEVFRKLQLAHHDCLMTTMTFFASQKKASEPTDVEQTKTAQI